MCWQSQVCFRLFPFYTSQCLLAWTSLKEFYDGLGWQRLGKVAAWMCPPLWCLLVLWQWVWTSSGWVSVCLSMPLDDEGWLKWGMAWNSSDSESLSGRPLMLNSVHTIRIDIRSYTSCLLATKLSPGGKSKSVLVWRGRNTEIPMIICAITCDSI